MANRKWPFEQRKLKKKSQEATLQDYSSSFKNLDEMNDFLGKKAFLKIIPQKNLYSQLCTEKN